MLEVAPVRELLPRSIAEFFFNLDWLERPVVPLAVA